MVLYHTDVVGGVIDLCGADFVGVVAFPFEKVVLFGKVEVPFHIHFYLQLDVLFYIDFVEWVVVLFHIDFVAEVAALHVDSVVKMVALSHIDSAVDAEVVRLFGIDFVAQGAVLCAAGFLVKEVVGNRLFETDHAVVNLTPLGADLDDVVVVLYQIEVVGLYQTDSIETVVLVHNDRVRNLVVPLGIDLTVDVLKDLSGIDFAEVMRVFLADTDLDALVPHGLVEVVQ